MFRLAVFPPLSVLEEHHLLRCDTYSLWERLQTGIGANGNQIQNVLVYNNNVTMCPLLRCDYINGTKLVGMPATVLDGKHTGLTTRLLVQRIVCSVIFHYCALFVVVYCRGVIMLSQTLPATRWLIILDSSPFHFY